MSGIARGAFEKIENIYPLAFYSSGACCLSSHSNSREAFQKEGKTPPMVWLSSGNYCLKSR
jgi:hypothetical protein